MRRTPVAAAAHAQPAGAGPRAPAGSL